MKSWERKKMGNLIASKEQIVGEGCEASSDGVKIRSVSSRVVENEKVNKGYSNDGRGAVEGDIGGREVRLREEWEGVRGMEELSVLRW